MPVAADISGAVSAVRHIVDIRGCCRPLHRLTSRLIVSEIEKHFTRLDAADQQPEGHRPPSWRHIGRPCYSSDDRSTRRNRTLTGRRGWRDVRQRRVAGGHAYSRTSKCELCSRATSSHIQVKHSWTALPRGWTWALGRSTHLPNALMASTLRLDGSIMASLLSARNVTNRDAATRQRGLCHRGRVSTTRAATDDECGDVSDRAQAQSVDRVVLSGLRFATRRVWRC